MTTDTPRTDALMRPNGALATNILEHARQLERELAASQAKVERLRERLNDCLSFVAFHGPVGAAKLLEKRILVTLNPIDK